MSALPNLLVVVSPHVGGRAVGSRMAGAFAGLAEVTVVESCHEDPGALSIANVIITGLAPVTASDLRHAPELRLVQCASHGFDGVDLATADELGVTVATIGSSDAEKQNVAEQTFALLLALAKQLVPAHNALVNGDWALPRLQTSITELSGKVLGIVGLGHIGREVAKRAAAFDMEVVHAEVGAGLALDDLLAMSDYVSLHLPLTAATHHLLDARRLTLMKPTAFVINTSRGALIDQAALNDALRAGTIAGAGLDVFDPEPPPADLPLLTAPNVVLSPHVAGVTRETLVRIAEAAAGNVVGYLRGAPLRDVVSRV
jgi:phosphoglycerate dehydrogenase-like enzyme